MNKILLGLLLFMFCVPTFAQERAIPINERVLHFGQKLRLLDHLGRVAHDKPYWKVNQKGHLIQMRPGTDLPGPKGQNFTIAGGNLVSINKLGFRQHGRNIPGLKVKN